MSLNLKRLSLTNARLEILTRTETDLQAQLLQLVKLREQFRTAQLSADLQRVERASEPAPVIAEAAVRHDRCRLRLRNRRRRHLVRLSESGRGTVKSVRRGIVSCDFVARG
jgi:hypothetical protein